MTAQEAISYIHSYAWQGSRPGLARTSELLARLDHPERALRFIHLAGTNGKGSTAALLASVLQAAGFRTGLYTSPYLSRFHERIQVNGVPISDEDLCAVTAAVRPHAETMSEHPTEFELVTCAALEHFRRTACAIVVLETGLGGRLDSTNAIPTPECAVITNIGLDHMAVLGNTVEEIAAEKAGIIKPGCEVAAHAQLPSVLDVLSAICTRRSAYLTVADFSRLEPISHSLEGQRFHYGPFRDLSLHLLGENQLHNAAVALEAVQILRRRGWALSDQAVRAGLASAVWPGRFELLDTAPVFLTDGGHNPQGAAATALNLRTYFPGQQVVFLLGVLQDKDYAGLTDQIAPLAQCFFTVTPDSPRALPAEALAHHLAGYGKPVTACASVLEGVAAAQAAAGGKGVVCSLGSLYLTGAVRTCFGR